MVDLFTTGTYLSETTAVISTAGRSLASTIVGDKKRLAVLVAAAIGCYIILKFLDKLREWKRRYLLVEALPSPATSNLWLSHLSDIVACPNVKDRQNDRNNAQRNVWPLIESWCKEMCGKKSHGGFRVSLLSPSRLPFASKCVFWAIDYELVKAVVNHPDLRTKGSTYDNSKSLIDHSVLIATGHDWKRMRKLTAKAFSNTVMKITHEASIRILHDKVFPYFEQKQSNTDNPYVDLVELIGRFTLDVLGIASFSYEFGGVDEFVSSETIKHHCDSNYKEHQQQQEQQQELYTRRCDYENKKTVYQILNEIAFDIQILDRYRGLYKPKRMDKNVCDLNNVISTVVDIKMEQQQCSINNNKSNKNIDLLDYLLESCNGVPILTREEIIGNTKVFSFAGHETTTTTMSTMFYELGRSPDVVKKLREEIDPYFDAEHGSACGPSYNDLRGNCTYVNKVVREILRLHPPALFSRTSGQKEVVLKTSKFQYVLPKNTEVIMGPWLSQRYYDSSINNNSNNNGADNNAKEAEEQGEKLRCEQPYDVFDPDRTIDYENDPFFPFAIGARNCVGREMAMAELRIVLAQVVHHYDLILKPEDEREGIEIYVVLTLKVGNYRMKFVKRKNKEEKKTK